MRSFPPFLFLRKLCWLGLFLPLSLAQGAEKPVIELGAGYVQSLLPQYPGSNEYYLFNVPFPYAMVRSDQVDVGENSALVLSQGEDHSLRFGLGFGLPVQSESLDTSAPEGIEDGSRVLVRNKSYLRRGMDHRPASVYFGLRSSYYLDDHWLLGASLMQGQGLSSKLPFLGGYLTTGFGWDWFDRDSPHALVLEVQSLWGSLQYNRNRYNVAEKDQLPDRPAYQARAGLVSHGLGLSLDWEISPSWNLLTGVVQDDLHQAVIQDSPLVRTKFNRSYFVTIFYKPLQSKSKVTRRK